MTVRDLEGVLHQVEIQASTLFEAAAAALHAFRQQGWAAGALTPNATLRVEVLLPSVVHDVPLRAIERWLKAPADSPRDQLIKRESGRRA